MISFLLDWMPKNWEEEPEPRGLEDPATPADAQYRADLLDQAAEKWAAFNPATQQAIISAVKQLDPQTDVEDLELLWQPRMD